MNTLKERLQQLAPGSSDNSPELANYDDIDLTLEETEAAIQKAKQEKYWRQKTEEWNQKIKAQPVWPMPTAKEYYSALLKTKSRLGKPFVVHEQNKMLVTQLCLYFSNDARFGYDIASGVPIGGFSKEKGILLMGNPGTGKNHIMNFFAKNPKASYRIPSCVDISEKYRNSWNYEGQDTIEFYSKNPKAEAGHPWNQTHLGFCFHDLGAEETERKNYGNSLNVMETILFNRYESKIDFYMTHVTTNLDETDIESLYGSRIRSRLREMFNVFVCDWKTMR